MDEKRSKTRPRTLKGAKIVFADGTNVIDCIIRNRSQDGAQLKVPSIVGIPDQFELHETATGERHVVTVIWRKVGLLGVKFG
jgi:hypothetical protein